MDQANDQQQAFSATTKATTMVRSALRPPSSIGKPTGPPTSSLSTQNSKLNSYIAQNRFRLLNQNTTSISTSTAITNTGTILKPLQRLQQQAEHLLPTPSSTTVTSGSKNSNLAHTIQPSIQMSSASKVSTADTTTRKPLSGYSGLARPTPLQQIVTSTRKKTLQRAPPSGLAKSSLATMPAGNQLGGSSQVKQQLNNNNNNNNIITTHKSSIQTLGGSQSKLTHLAQMRPQTSTTLIRPKGVSQTSVISSTIADEKRPKALSAAELGPRPPMTAGIAASTCQNGPSGPVDVDGQQNDALAAVAARLIDLTSVENDVSEIRRLLEQLLSVLQATHQDQDNKERENERLRQEVRELKSKIRSICSAVAVNADSESHLYE